MIPMFAINASKKYPVETARLEMVALSSADVRAAGRPAKKLAPVMTMAVEATEGSSTKNASRGVESASANLLSRRNTCIAATVKMGHRKFVGAIRAEKSGALLPKPAIPTAGSRMPAPRPLPE